MAAVSSRRVSAGVYAVSLHVTSARGMPPQNLPPLTVMSVRREVRPHPSSLLARCAFGMPMKAAGEASARHPFIFLAPMPGSIKTGTAPHLKSAKVTANSSGEGGTSRAVRTPLLIPILSKPAASLLLQSSSSRKVSVLCCSGKMMAAVSGCSAAISVSGREIFTKLSEDIKRINRKSCLNRKERQGHKERQKSFKYPNQKLVVRLYFASPGVLCGE